MNKATIVLIFRILLGGVFIFSGIAKLQSIYQFEQAIFKAGISSWEIIPYLSRFIIASEIFLGLCFFHKEGLKKFTIPATFLMLVVFTIHLGYEIITTGGLTGNCGCFGETIQMNPLESLIKNIVMFGMLVYLYKNPIEKPAREIAIPVSFGILSFLYIAVFFPVKPYVTTHVSDPVTTASIITTNDSSDSLDNNAIKTDTIQATPSDTKTDIKPKEIKAKEVLKAKVSTTETKQVDPLEVKKVEESGPALLPKTISKFAPFKNFSDGKTIDLDEGIKIVTMYNTGCEHCMENAKKVHELSKKMSLPIGRILFWGNESEIPAFFEFTKSTFPYKFVEPQVFFPLLGKGNFPKIILLNNGNIVGEWEGDDSPQQLEKSLVDMKWVK
jgi:uncharacterized membrane protein YphA (DoxX/SURF4 family)